MTARGAIVATLAYHDIFDYPLTLEELNKYLIDKSIGHDQLELEVNGLVDQKKVKRENFFYFLKNHSKIAQIRRQRLRYSSSKLKKAAFYATLLKVVPTIKLVAISGALAMNNSHKDDDIDLVIFSQKGTLWTTRFLSNLILLPFKRDPQGKKISDRACLNIFIDESSLKIKNQNLYTAHEIAQLKPLWDRSQTYKRFIKANAWIRKYLPNWRESSEFIDHRSEKKSLRTINYLLPTVENLLKNFQLWYMRKKITTEKIEKGQLFFHPSNTQERVIGEYKKSLKKFGII